MRRKSISESQPCRCHLCMRRAEDIILFPIGTGLLAGHADSKYLVGPFREFGEHLLASPAEQNRFELTVDLVQPR